MLGPCLSLGKVRCECCLQVIDGHASRLQTGRLAEQKIRLKGDHETMNDAVRKITPAPAAEPLYREAPNNIEAEQALLGAILVNNDAYYRVSDFLKPVHLYEPLHRKIFEVAGDIIRMGKTANPVTIKTFLPQTIRSAT